MATQFVPVELTNIEQGAFIVECDKAFSKLQRDFVAHVNKNGHSSAAMLNMSVKINYDAAKKGFSIVTGVDPKLPKNPSGITTAFIADDINGQPTLFTQSAGTQKGDPKQARLQTADGKTIS